MSPSPLIAIGASAGGLDPLRTVVKGLPGDLDATVLVVLHMAPEARSMLADILGRGTQLRVVAAEDGAAVEASTIVVARPGRHLLLDEDRIVLGGGPRENGHRPAVDPMMLSVAKAAGERACGVVLSGARDDGTVGLSAISEQGGTAIVQDPEEAVYPGMPSSALRQVPAATVLKADDITAALVSFVRGEPVG